MIKLVSQLPPFFTERSLAANSGRFKDLLNDSIELDFNARILSFKS